MVAEKNNKYARKYTDEDIDKLGEELINFAENDRSIHFVRFTRKHNKGKSWLLDLARYYPKFAEYLDLARDLMAAKITDLSFYDKESGVNASFGEKNLFRYDKEWVEHMKFKSDLTRASKDDSTVSLEDIRNMIQAGNMLKALSQPENEKK